MSNRHEAIGISEEFLDLQERIRRVAPIDRAVLLIGERGTGKELAAVRLHLLSGRWNKPYITLNCASLSPSLIESELFGHEAGAFTGANRKRVGRFELADGGTLFLDEIADLPKTAQEKILRVVEYGFFERVGGDSTIRADVRLIAATNVDLRKLAKEGQFRQDLLDRLSFEVLTLPPLRARGEDILELTKYFARRMSAELEQNFLPQFSPEAKKELLRYDWPGNIRELKNVVERMVYRTRSPLIDHVVFDPFESTHSPGQSPIPTHDPPAPQTPIKNDDCDSGELDYQELENLPLEQAVVELRVARLRDALENTHFNQKQAAQQLGLTYDQFRGYYRKHEQRILESESA